MKQQVDVTLKLVFWIDATLSKDSLAAMVRERLNLAFADEFRAVLNPIEIQTLREEAEIYNHELPCPSDAYEISGVREFDDPSGKYCEPVTDEEASFWSLYAHIPNEGIVCIGDFSTRRFAEEIYARITGRAY